MPNGRFSASSSKVEMCIRDSFKTAKYRPEFPARGFADQEAARAWGQDFVQWYNGEHRHSGIRYVTPAQRHAGEDIAILAARHQTYLQAVSYTHLDVYKRQDFWRLKGHRQRTLERS